jgi:hypothetical protein
MSLQDDYFDLENSLEGWQKAAFLRIWEAFVDMENEHEELLAIRGAVRKMVELTFKQEREQDEQSPDQAESSAGEKTAADAAVQQTGSGD